MTTKVQLQSIIFPILFTFGVILFLFRSLLFQFDRALLDGIDYPLYAWILQTGIANVGKLFSQGLFFGNAFYPSMQALLFSDTFYPLSFLLLPLSLLTQSPFIILNTGVLVTLFLNVVSAAVLTRNFTSKRGAHTLLTLIFSVSPYFFTQIPHLQMLSFWPSYLMIHVLFIAKRPRSFLAVAMLLSMQWYLSVYLGTMALVIASVWWLVSFFGNNTRRDLVRNVLLSGFVFLLLTGPLLIAYRNIRNVYQATPDAGMFVDYAAQPTDYFFSRGEPTVLALMSPFKLWNTLNHRGAGEPARWIGFAVLFLGTCGIIMWRKSEDVMTKKAGWFAIILAVVGLVFSFGTRLTLNGTYTGFPLPYLLVLKSFPILSFFRSPSRWYFLFVLGWCVFSALGVQRLLKTAKSRQWIIALGIVYAAEMFPMQIPVTTISKPDYVEWLSNTCRPGDVVLSLPIFSHYGAGTVALNPSPTSQLMMWTVNSQCRLLNGYSGILPSSLKELDQRAKLKLDSDFVRIARERGVTLLLMHQVPLETVASFSTVPDVQLIDQDHTSSLWRLLPNQKN
ncbi:hypothetical protein KBD71_00295 [Candidatus Woesebacteria bacterium]|nr:hypothetical protein [Candidatus Woesebacteria bacterium]